MSYSGFRPAGYDFLIERYGVDPIPNPHHSAVGSTGAFRIVRTGDRVEATYPLAYWPGDLVGDHLEFAIKNDGIDLGVLYALFTVIPEEEIVGFVSSKPTGIYSRKIWYLYEILMNRTLPLPDLHQGNYIALLEVEKYYASNKPIRIGRQRVLDNLLGTPAFCPMVRRTEELVEWESLDIRARTEELVRDYPPDLLHRALNYLYTKETRSSFLIENIRLEGNRTEKFVDLLKKAEERDFCEPTALVGIQNQIVDPRFAEPGYRTDQNYVGQSVSLTRQVVHYVCPKPTDVPDLMEGLVACHRRLMDSGVPAVIHAAVISFGFVYLHPFLDGNGRLHRFLIHNILSLRQVVPDGLMFPVSAAILKDPREYDRTLEAFSKPLMARVRFQMDVRGRLEVDGDTGGLYRFMDLTSQTESLYGFMKKAIETELVEELGFLSNYDRTRRSIQAIVDMPDAQIDLFIGLCLQNQGRLSARKRESHFAYLTDEEIGAMEQAVRDGYELG
jgi:hypothetical protein